ncbi:MAG: IS110 family transposase [Gammaproteobacteria bacterium]|nr:IS110 family transposase [Gammaproteobacteria bacterium]
MELQWYVGVDREKAEHSVCFLNTTGVHVAERKTSHTGIGFAELTTRLSEQTNQAEAANIGVALETSSGPVVD